MSQSPLLMLKAVLKNADLKSPEFFVFKRFFNPIFNKNIAKNQTLLAVIIGLSMGLTACDKAQNNNQDQTNKDSTSTTATSQDNTYRQEIELLSSDIITAKAERYQPSVTVTGTLQASDKTAVQSTVSAQVQKVLVDIGQPVKKNQPLIQLDSRDSDNQLAQAQADVSATEAQAQVAIELAQKNKILLEQGFVSEMEYKRSLADAKAQQAFVKAKKAQLDIVKKQAGDTVIVAPADGIIGSRNVNAGQIVAPNQPLMEIINPKKLEFSANVPSEAQPISIGQSVPFQVTNATDQFVGQISRVAPQIDPTTRQLPIFITVKPEQNGYVLKAGQFATGQLDYGQIQVGVLIPITAVSFDSNATPTASNVTATNPVVNPNLKANALTNDANTQNQTGMVNVIGQDHIIKTQPVQIIRRQDDSGQYLVTGIEQGTVVITIPIKAEQVGKKVVLK